MRESEVRKRTEIVISALHTVDKIYTQFFLLARPSTYHTHRERVCNDREDSYTLVYCPKDSALTFILFYLLNCEEFDYFGIWY